MSSWWQIHRGRDKKRLKRAKFHTLLFIMRRFLKNIRR
jgi:hypothetical protein